MKRIVIRRAIGLLLAFVMACTCAFPVFAEVDWDVFPQEASTYALPQVAAGVATPTNLSNGGWPGVATPTDLSAGWQDLVTPGDLSASAGKLVLTEQSSGEPMTRLYLEPGQTAAFQIRDIAADGGLTELSDIGSVQISFTYNSAAWDATPYYEAVFVPETGTVALTAKQALPTFESSGTVGGYRMTCTVGSGESVRCAYLYLLKEPVAVSVYNDTRGAVYTAGNSYTLALDPSLTDADQVSVQVLNNSSLTPVSTIAASVNEAKDAIALSIDAACEPGFYRIRLNSEWNDRYAFSDCLIYVADLIFYATDTGIKAGTIEYQLPVDRNQAYSLSLGDINGVFTPDQIQSVEVSPSALTELTGSGSSFVLRSNGTEGKEEIVVQATMTDGSVRRGILGVSVSVAQPVMLLKASDGTPVYSAVAGVPVDCEFYLDGRCASEETDWVRLKDVEILNQKNAEAEVNLEQATVRITSPVAMMRAELSLRIVYETYDLLTDTWHEKEELATLSWSVSPKATLQAAFVDLSTQSRLNYLELKEGATYQVQIGSMEYANGQVAVYAWPEDAPVHFVGIGYNFPFYGGEAKPDISFDVTEYFDIEPIDGVNQGYSITCKKPLQQHSDKSVWNYYLSIDAAPEYYSYGMLSLLKENKTWSTDFFVDGNPATGTAVQMLNGVASEFTSGFVEEQNQNGVSCLAAEYSIARAVDSAFVTTYEPADEFFTKEQTEAGVRIIPNADCPMGTYVMTYYTEYADSTLQKDFTLEVSDVFLVMPYGRPAEALYDIYPGRETTFTFMDYYGTIVNDEIQNVSLTGGGESFSMERQGEKIILRALPELGQGTLQITLELADGRVRTFSVPYSQTLEYGLSVKNVETGETLKNHQFRVGVPETFQWSTLDQRAVAFGFTDPAATEEYFDVTIDDIAKTVTFLPKADASSLALDCNTKDENGNWLYDNKAFTVSILEANAVQLVRLDGREDPFVDGSMLIGLQYPEGPQQIANVEVKASNSYITITPQGNDTYLVECSDLMSGDQEDVYAVVTYADGSIAYSTLAVAKRAWTGIQQLSPNRKLLQFASLNQDGTFSGVTSTRYYLSEEEGQENWQRQYLYITEYNDPTGRSTPVMDGIESIVATSSNENVARVSAWKKTVDGTAYYFECDTNIAQEGIAEIVATITYESGIVRQLSMRSMVSKNQAVTTYVDVSNDILMEQGKTLQQFIDSAQVPPSIGSRQTILRVAAGEYNGDIVLRKRVTISGTQSWDPELGETVIETIFHGGIQAKGEAQGGCSVNGIQFIGTGAASSVAVRDMSVYSCLIDGYEIGVDSGYVSNTTIQNCTYGVKNTRSESSTIQNNDVGLYNDSIYVFFYPNKCKFINNGLHIQNMAQYTLSATDNYFRMDTETSVKEFPYAACFEGDVNVEPYYVDEELTTLSIVPDEDSGEVVLKPEDNKVTIDILDPTTAQISNTIFEEAKNASASEDDAEKVETLTFDMKSSEGETDVVWEFKTADLVDTTISPSLAVKLDFVQLASDEQLTAEEKSAKEAITDILDQVGGAQQGDQSVKYQSISFTHKGALPGPATVTIRKNDALKGANNLKLYYYNPETSSLEWYKDVEIVDNGDTISFVIDHCSEYVITPSEIDEDICAVYKISLAEGSSLNLSETKRCLSNIQPGATVGEVREQLAQNSDEMIVTNIKGDVMSDAEVIGTGTRITYKNATIDIVIFGDINGDGQINIRDVVAVASLLLHSERENDLNAYQKYACRAATNSSVESKISIVDLVAINACALNKASIVQSKLI